MFGFTRTKNTERVAEVRAALQSTEAELAAARERLGIAIADGADGGARAARDEIAQLSARVAELSAVLPVTERRASEAAQREHAERIRKQNEAANLQRAKRLQAARAVDRALVSLGKAFDAYIDTAPGGTPEARVRLHRRSGISLRAAIFHHAPSLGSALEIPRIATAFRRPLADSESGVLPKLDESDVEGAA